MVPVDKDKLASAIKEAEKNGPLTNLGELWKKATEIYNANPGVEQITFSVVMLRAIEWKLEIQTKPGRKGRTMTQEQKDALRAGLANRPRVSKAEKFEKSEVAQEHIASLKSITPPRFQGLVDGIATGSRADAVKLTCVACMGYEGGDDGSIGLAIHNCSSHKSCPLYLFRPYQKKTEAEAEVTKPNEPTVSEDVPEVPLEDTEPTVGVA